MLDKALTPVVKNAAACAVLLQRDSGRFRFHDHELSLHIAMSTGSLACTLLGGQQNSFKYLCSGPTYTALANAMEYSGTGEVSRDCHLVIQFCLHCVYP